MIEKLRAELKAIHDWPTGNLPTDTENCRSLSGVAGARDRPEGRRHRVKELSQGSEQRSLSQRSMHSERPAWAP